MSPLPPIDVDELEQSVQRQPMALRLLTIALQALSSRALVWAAFAGATTLWMLAMANPTTLTMIAATGYCVTVLLPVLVRDAKGG